MVLRMITGRLSRGARYSHSYAQVLKSTQAQANLTELNNGIRVATEQTKSPSATVGIYINNGSVNETKEDNGITHFIEHLLFQGSKNRNKKQLEKDVYGMGAMLNSFTDRETSGFYVTCAPKDIPKALEIISDLVVNPALNADDIEATRKTILRELEELEGDHEQVVMDYLHSVAYQGTPLANSKYGPTANVQRFTKADIQAGLDRFVKSPQIVVAASGDVNHDQLVKEAEKHLKGVSNIFELNDIPGFAAKRYTGSDIRLRDDSLGVAHVAFAIQGPGYNNPDFVAMDIVSSLLGNWDLTHGGGVNVSSYMGMVSAADHLAQSFKSFNLKYQDTALWGNFFVGEKMTLEEMLWQLQTQWKRLCVEVANNEIRQGKNALMTKLICEREGSANNAKSIATDIFNYGKRMALEDWADKIDSVNSKKVHSICENYIWDRCPVVAAVGAVEALPHYEEIRWKMSWIRY